jgi:hypothetical protein
MPLTVGITRYDNSRGHTLRDLTQNADFQQMFDATFQHSTDADKRRAMEKLGRWISHVADPLIPLLRKGQDKSFAGLRELMSWLKYQTEKRFADNAQRERQLAEMINDCPGIRQTVAAITTRHLQTYWDGLAANVKRQNADLRGRYAHFYSNFLSNRRLGDGITYFRNKRNPSLSEMAAFLADFALKHTLMPPPTFTRGHEGLRYNNVKLQRDIADALNDLEATRRRRERAVPRIRTEAARWESATGLLTDTIPLQQFLSDANLRRIFEQYKSLDSTQRAPDEIIYNSEEFRQIRRENLDIARREANRYNRELHETEASLTPDAVNLEKENTKKAATRSNRLAYNVAPEHDWAAFMMQQSQVIGAGPSSTTSATLELVKLIFPAGRYDCDLHRAYYSVAVALFAFWRRKKNLLRGSSSVHSWNEVITALENYLDYQSDFIFPVDQAFVPEDPALQRRVYEYPDRFTEKGIPVFLNHNA